DHRRIICKRTGNRNALLLTTAKFTRQTAGEVLGMCQFQADESAVPPRSSLESTAASQFERQEDVFDSRKRWNQLKKLKDDSNMPSTPAGETVLIHRPQFLPFKEHTSTGGTVNTCEHIKQSRFPTAGWSLD